MKRYLILACVLASATALATVPSTVAKEEASRPPPCQEESTQRMIKINGDDLRGILSLEPEAGSGPMLNWVKLKQAQLDNAPLKGLRLDGGTLRTPTRSPEKLVGAVLQGVDGNGQPVDVAVCGATPAEDDPKTVSYQIKVWNSKSGTWQNPCTPTYEVQSPQVLAVRGVWDDSGARRKDYDRFTFACETGVIGKCILAGYKPWGKKGRYSLEDLHQACTRMMRADYCGDGRSHTRPGTTVEIQDDAGVLLATKGLSERDAPFEAVWTPNGAWCMASTRGGETLETIVDQCPGVFVTATANPGQGERCAVQRKGKRPSTPLLHSHRIVQHESARAE